MGLGFVLDTNMVIYHLADRLYDRLPTEKRFLSVVSRIELLSFPDITSVQQASANAFIERCELVSVTSTVADIAIALRKEFRLKVPDAVICATAISLDLPLHTNDIKLHGISSLQA